jgi:CRP-like cAMP-binding protein
VDFGLMAALTLAVAWLIDVVFTPALCARLRIVTVWDLLSLDLGDDPRRSIPLFAGLRLTQARIVALLGSLHAFPKGHVLTRVGEFADEMWIIIDGELRASLPTEGREVEFGICRRGDTVGEVALFHGQRTAEVVAMTDVRLLRFTHASLDRIRRRYPRIGARLYANLSRILAKRVAVTTDLVGSAKREPARGSNVPSLVE